MINLVCRRVLAHLQPVHLLLLVVPTPADAMRTAVHLRVDRARVPQPGRRRGVARAPVADRHEAVGIGSAERRKHQASTEHAHTELFVPTVEATCLVCCCLPEVLSCPCPSLPPVPSRSVGCGDSTGRTSGPAGTASRSPVDSIDTVLTHDATGHADSTDRDTVLDLDIVR